MRCGVDESAPTTVPGVLGSPFAATDIRMGRAVALIGEEAGKYPWGNSLLVAGTEERLLIDPSLSIYERGGAPTHIDRVFVSHAHEDHIAGIAVLPDAQIHAHTEDLLGLHSLEGFLQVYGMPAAIEKDWGPEVLERFHYTARPDATAFVDGQRFDLGGCRVEVVHLPGHTRGHCGFLIEPDGVFFVADVDLSGFGPYYGDHWSDLEDFERAIGRCREIEARHYVTFHHKGIVSGREDFLAALDTFAAVIGQRERRMLEFLREPRTLDEMIRHRFIYRPDVELLFADHVESKSIGMHLRRFMRTGAVAELEPGRFRAA